MYDITILVPSIRTGRLIKFYESAQKACKNHTWQLLTVGPFDPPFPLHHYANVKHLQDYGQVSRCVQRAVLECDSELFFLTVDDCTLIENSLDEAIDLYKSSCRAKLDMVSCMYREGNNTMDPDYWRSGRYGELRFPSVNPEWKLAMQFIIAKELFIQLGGFDCRWEYINECVHDFAFRLQRNGGQVLMSPGPICDATWYPGTIVDHKVIHDAQTGHDWPLFQALYNSPMAANRIEIEYDNWTDTPATWERRFGASLPRSYKELCVSQGYEYREENG